MIRIKDHKQQHLFDPWGYLSPKRRRMLERGWPGLFRQHLLGELPVEELTAFFTEAFGRPTKELHSLLGVMLFQQSCQRANPSGCGEFGSRLAKSAGKIADNVQIGRLTFYRVINLVR